MKESEFDLSKLTGLLEDIAKNVDLKPLEDFKKSIDKDKVINESTKLLEKLTDSLPADDQQSIINIINALLPKNEK